MNDAPEMTDWMISLEGIDEVLENPEFRGWPKIPRLMKDMVITEKIDGTNAQIFIGADGFVRAGSRKRWVTSADDNHGFGRWVEENQDELRRILRPGRHFGEWWGQGIQRHYNMKRKVFSLFNTNKWSGIFEINGQLQTVPILDIWMPFNTTRIEQVAKDLRETGSWASSG